MQTDDIIYIETARHKNVFYTKKQTYTIYKKMDEIEEELSGFGFVRIHRSFLVNMRYIEKISSYVLRLITGKEISVPKSRYQEVKCRYAFYKGAERSEMCMKCSLRKNGHGIGLKNVGAVVEKYDGSIAFECDEKEFKTVVVL